MRVSLALGALAVAFLASCTERETPAPAGAGDAAAASSVARGAPVVAVTIEANRYLAARIGGERVRVLSPVPADADPLLWEPDRAAIAALQGADLALLNGAGLERWLDRVSLAPSRTVLLAKEYESEWLTFAGTVEHQHGPEGEHTHTGTDPHVWMDPLLAKRHAERIAAELAVRFPEHAAEYMARAAELIADLDDLDRRFRAARAPGSPPLLANHPAYDYLARRYGWTIASFDLDPEALPAGGLALAGAPAGARAILWESAPAAEVDAAARALGYRSIVISPCEHPPESGDWLETMRTNARAIAAIGD